MRALLPVAVRADLSLLDLKDFLGVRQRAGVADFSEDGTAAVRPEAQAHFRVTFLREKFSATGSTGIGMPTLREAASRTRRRSGGARGGRLPAAAAGPPLLVPARALLWRRVAHLAYASLPPYAHRLYGRRAPEPATVTRELRAMGTLLRCVPARVRWQLPPKHVLRAMARLGPEARPDPFKVGR